MDSQFDSKVAEPLSRAEAEYRDAQDPLRSFRECFLIPSTQDLQRKTLAEANGMDYCRLPDAIALSQKKGYSCLQLAEQEPSARSDRSCIYLCGNSLGLQPRQTRKYIDYYLRAWATKGVTGHFIHHDDELVPPFVDVDQAGSMLMAPIVGAHPSEVATMGSLTGNIHVLFGSFYCPNQERYKIIMEGKAFPSDHVSSVISVCPGVNIRLNGRR